jgi:hypothetical protein
MADAMQKINPNERRGESRYETGDCIADILTTASRSGFSGRIMDVSRSGMRLRTDRSLKTSGEVTMTLEDAIVEAEVCYSRPNEVGSYDAGLRIEVMQSGFRQSRRD